MARSSQTIATVKDVKKTPHKRPGRHAKKAPKGQRRQTLFTGGACR